MIDTKSILEFATPVALIILGVMQQIQGAKAKQAAAESKQAVVENKAATKEIHALVNSNFIVQLRVAAAALRRVADLTGEATDIKIAWEAEVLLQDYIRKQTASDDSLK